MKDELRKILDDNWYEKLPNKNAPHNKLVIGFSDIPGSGLTDDLSIKIAEKYRGIWIPKDTARTLIYENEKIESVQQVEDILDEYIDDMLDKLIELPNGLLVVNASVDRKYEFYRDWAKLNGYEMYIIGFIVGRDEVMKQVRKDRDKKTADWFEDHLDGWYRDQEKFNQLYGANFYIKNHNEKQADELFLDLDKIIS